MLYDDSNTIFVKSEYLAKVFTDIIFISGSIYHNHDELFDNCVYTCVENQYFPFFNFWSEFFQIDRYVWENFSTVGFY